MLQLVFPTILLLVAAPIASAVGVDILDGTAYAEATATSDPADPFRFSASAAAGSYALPVEASTISDCAPLWYTMESCSGRLETRAFGEIASLGYTCHASPASVQVFAVCGASGPDDRWRAICAIFLGLYDGPYCSIVVESDDLSLRADPTAIAGPGYYCAGAMFLSYPPTEASTFACGSAYTVGVSGACEQGVVSVAGQWTYHVACLLVTEEEEATCADFVHWISPGEPTTTRVACATA